MLETPIIVMLVLLAIVAVLWWVYHRIAANIAKLPELFSILSLLVATALAPQPAQKQINGEPRNEDGNSTSGHDGRVEDVRIYAERLAQFLVPKVAVGNIRA